ncbi:MAG: RNA polymerase sigma factor [Phycisphaerales bacterium]
MTIDREETAGAADADALVFRALEGDGRALTRLLLMARDAAAPGIERKVRNSARLSGATSAEDLLQDACFAAVRDLRRGMFRPAETACGAYESFLKWFGRVARNRVLDKLDEVTAEKRGGGRARVAWDDGDGSRGSKLPRAVVDNLMTPSRGMKKSELVAAVQEALGRIRPVYRSVLEMKMILGLSHREIGEQLKKEEATVRKLLSRAISAVAREVGDYSKYITRV